MITLPVYVRAAAIAARPRHATGLMLGEHSRNAYCTVTDLPDVSVPRPVSYAHETCESV
jgi:hypothetical protein